MRLIQNVNLEAVARRTIPRSLTQLADLINTTVGGSINLNHIDRIPRPNLGTRFTNPTRLRHRLFRRAAVQSHSQNTGNGRLPNSPMSAKNLTMRNPALFNGILERTGNVILPNDLRKLLRTVFTCQDLITHGRERSIIRD